MQGKLSRDQVHSESHCFSMAWASICLPNICFLFYFFTSMSIVFLSSEVPTHYPKHLLSLNEDSLVVVVLSHVWLFETPWTAARQASFIFTVSNSCPLSPWCHPAISSSVIPFSSCPLSFPASGSSPMSQLFTSGEQNIGALASASVLLMNIQVWFL